MGDVCGSLFDGRLRLNRTRKRVIPRPQCGGNVTLLFYNRLKSAGNPAFAARLHGPAAHKPDANEIAVGKNVGLAGFDAHLADTR